MYKTAITLITILICALTVKGVPHEFSPGVAVDDYVEAFAERDYYIQKRKCEIDSVGALPKSARNEFMLANLWRKIQVDSAVAHMRIANDMAERDNDFSLHIMAGSAICSLLPHIDAAGEALSHFQLLDTVTASHEARLHYHMAGQEIWFTLANTTVLDTIRNIYLRNGAEHSKAICAMTHHNDVRHNLAAAHNAFVLGHNAMLVANLNEVLKNPLASHYDKACANLLMSRHYERESVGDTTMANYYTLRSGAEYIRDGNLLTNTTAIAALLLLDDPTTPINPEALRMELGNTLAGGSSIVAGDSAPYLTLLTDMNAATISRQSIFIAVLCILCVLLVVCLIYLYVCYKNKYASRQELAELNVLLRKDNTRTRQAHINNIIQMCDRYMESTDEFLRSARRKLSAGQISELKLQLKGGKLLDDQHKMFYDAFDSAFYHTYPNFVNEVNCLLQSDKQIELQSHNSLSTELRIAAFARLGVDDSAKVARFLGLSLTTVYTYRNKLRAKAMNRATFFQDLQNQDTDEILETNIPY